MIQGKSKIIEDARNHEKNSKSLESEIKEELKRIYKVKDPKTDNKVVRKMDRILPPIRL